MPPEGLTKNVLYGGNHSNDLRDLAPLRHPLRLVSRQYLEDALIGATNTGQLATRIGRELGRRLSRPSRRLRDHRRLEFIESPENERRTASSVFPTGRQHNTRINQFANALARRVHAGRRIRANHHHLTNDVTIPRHSRLSIFLRQRIEDSKILQRHLGGVDLVARQKLEDFRDVRLQPGLCPRQVIVRHHESERPYGEIGIHLTFRNSLHGHEAIAKSRARDPVSGRPSAKHQPQRHNDNANQPLVFHTLAMPWGRSRDGVGTEEGRRRDGVDSVPEVYMYPISLNWIASSNVHLPQDHR